MLPYDRNSSVLYSLRNVCKSVIDGQHNKNILSNISLDINQGDFCGVKGESGAGKSTLLNILGGMEKMTSGEFLFEGRDIANKNSSEMAKFRREIGFIFQSFQLIDHLNVHENVSIPLMLKGASHKNRDSRVFGACRKAQLIKDVFIFPEQDYSEFLDNHSNPEQIQKDLLPFLVCQDKSIVIETHRMPEKIKNLLYDPALKKYAMTMGISKLKQSLKTLSGGEQQRVAIARAIVNNPRVILADEPTGNLDSSNEDQILALLQELHSTLGITIIIVSHSEKVISRCRRVIQIADGAIVDDYQNH